MAASGCCCSVARRWQQHWRGDERSLNGGPALHSNPSALQRRQSRDTGASARSPFGLPMLAPTHPFIAGWSTALLLLDLTYTAILLPLAFGFRLNKEPGWLELSMVVGLLFTVDMIVMLHRWGDSHQSPTLLWSVVPQASACTRCSLASSRCMARPCAVRGRIAPLPPPHLPQGRGAQVDGPTPVRGRLCGRGARLRSVWRLLDQPARRAQRAPAAAGGRLGERGDRAALAARHHAGAIQESPDSRSGACATAWYAVP